MHFKSAAESLVTAQSDTKEEEGDNNLPQTVVIELCQVGERR